MPADDVGISDVALGRELDAFFRHRYDDCDAIRDQVFGQPAKILCDEGTGISDAAEIFADAREFGGRHLDYGLVLCFRDPKVLAVDVHQLHLKIGDLILIYTRVYTNWSG